VENHRFEGGINERRRRYIAGENVQPGADRASEERAKKIWRADDINSSASKNNM